MPPQTIHLALPLTWYDGGTWLSCEPHTISFLGLGRWKRYLGHSSLKRKFSHSSAVNLRYLRANTKRAFRWLLLRSGSFFRLKGFHPFLDIYLHTVAADPWRPLFFSCLLIFLVKFPLSYFAFSITFFAVLSSTSWLVVKLLWTWPLRYPALAFLQYFSRFLAQILQMIVKLLPVLLNRLLF